MSVTEGDLRHLAHSLAVLLGMLGVGLVVLSVVFALRDQRGWSLTLAMAGVLCAVGVLAETLVDRHHRGGG